MDVPGSLPHAGRPTWRFPRAFWTGNAVELFERAAYYGTFIALAVFLTDVVGFGDVAAGWIGALFSSSIYLLPFVTGALSDRLGFRPSLLLAFTLLALGYGGLALFPTRGAVPFSLALVAVGGAFVKPVITGTVARSSDSVSRARAFSLFYMMVNIGSFTGKTVAKPVRALLGVGSVPLYSAFAALAALLVTALFFFPRENGEEGPRSLAESLHGLTVVLKNGRFMALILITAGFWAIQGQLYASMPKYVLRLVGPKASPEWYANVNPLVVVLLVVPVTHLVRRISPVASIGVALGLIPLSALVMSLSGHLQGPVGLFGASLHPVTVLMVGGIALQGLAECFLSPRYLEFASRQAPPGQEGLYMGYAHLNTFFAWLFGFALSGYLLEAFCPDPKKLRALGLPEEAFAAAYAHAHYLWYAFAGVGLLAFLGLIAFALLTGREKRGEGK